MTQASGWFVNITKATVCLAMLLWSALTPTATADPVYGNYLVGNGYHPGLGYIITEKPFLLYQCDFADNSSGLDQAMAFTVPPGIDYQLDRIELTLWMPGMCNLPAVVELRSDAAGIPGATYAFIGLSPAIVQNPAPVFYTATTSALPVLHENTKYWLVVAGVPLGPPYTQVIWKFNGAGAKGPVANRSPSGIWSLSSNNAMQGVFRVVGTPIIPPPINPSYSSYTAPSTPGTATVYLEIVCPGSPLSNPFTMPVDLSLVGGETQAQVCQLLSNAINNCSGCPCWGGCPTTAPYGFQADCSGSVLRVTNSTLGLCTGAYVCADHADGLTKYSPRKQLESVGGAIALEIRGEATGIPRDFTVNNSVEVIRTLRCPPNFSPRVLQAQVRLGAGMGATQIIHSLAAAFSLQGDNNVVVEGNRVIFSPSCEQGEYDIAFQVNDTGVVYAFSPPFAYSFLDYVAQFTTSIPTLTEWGLIIFCVLLVGWMAWVIVRRKKKMTVGL